MFNWKRSLLCPLKLNMMKSYFVCLCSIYEERLCCTLLPSIKSRQQFNIMIVSLSGTIGFIYLNSLYWKSSEFQLQSNSIMRKTLVYSFSYFCIFHCGNSALKPLSPCGCVEIDLWRFKHRAQRGRIIKQHSHSHSTKEVLS